MTPRPTVVTDDALAAEWSEIQAAQQDAAAFAPLYDRYYEPIFRFIYRRAPDESVAVDLCSQTFLKALQNLPRYQYRGVPFSAWLYRIASNEVAQYFRNSGKQRTVSLQERQVASVEAATYQGDTAHELQMSQLVKALDYLKEKDLQLIEMRFFEERPFKEIADVLGITESNAKVRTYRILKRLKKRFF